MFWKFNLITTSHIETLLSKENVTLKELMEEDDILQECKAQSKKLIDFLIRSEVLEDMVNLITQEPPEDMDEKVRYKYPNIACELLTADVPQINDALASNEPLLNKLYYFLDTEKPLNPLLASFFSKTMGLLISRKTEPVFEFLKSKEDFLTLLLNHISTSAIMDLLLRLITCVENSVLRQTILKWLCENNLVGRLVSIIDPAYSEEENSNASQALSDIVKYSREQLSLLQDKADPDPLLESIECCETVEHLLKHMFDRERKESVLVSGIGVLLSLVEFKKPGPGGLQGAGGQPGQFVQGDQQQLQRIVPIFFPNELPDQITQLDAERISKGVNKVLAAVVPRLSDFHNLLLNPPPKSSILTTVGTLDPPLGYTRLEVAHLITALLTTNSDSVRSQLATLGTVDVLLDLFFRYSWNNFLHTEVEQSIRTILNSQPSTDEQKNKLNNPLLDQLFTQCNLVQRILDAWKNNEEEQSLPGKHRKGYMGHVTKIANDITDNIESGPNSELIKTKLKDLPENYNSQWESFVSETLAEINKKQQTPLVSGVPLPSSSEDEECPDFRDIPFSQHLTMQPAFSDYQMHQITSTFIDQFGFNDDEFVDTDENLADQLNRIAQEENIAGQLDRLVQVNFQLAAEENMRSAELFEQACRERAQSLGDTDSDEDIWEDKEHEVTFASGTISQASTLSCRRQSSDDNSSDSEEAVHQKPSSTPLSGTADVVKMEVDQSDLLEERKFSSKNIKVWASSFNTLPMDQNSVAMDTSNPWEAASVVTSQAVDPSGWADFSNFPKLNTDEAFSSSTPMETVETNNNPSMVLANSQTVDKTSSPQSKAGSSESTSSGINQNENYPVVLPPNSNPGPCDKEKFLVSQNDIHQEVEKSSLMSTRDTAASVSTPTEKHHGKTESRDVKDEQVTAEPKVEDSTLQNGPV
ncbi:phosphatase 6 regulatory subunit 1-like protein fmt isoform X3 [Tachypleus tridentatus]|uniref:phosphatase 6 regulatory subunit 1-like protein fmt isoform X3 n=1 Tax=Tachypleus tridentatus TaxID=6853 RepID=UPI003FD4B699